MHKWEIESHSTQSQATEIQAKLDEISFAVFKH